ncbi:hypothetical protein EST38_g14146 [Candolleomyces aberdarensis]|uniref:Uncharacterized protein n=1 Tax=Candolleomyces aberdarensis TaxID=2316362 RepID=A0A4Q2CZ03_9AGAR|nr:hypothetical protein EST38_g14146 [Candolleomyces aberdarensis]
MLNPSMPLSHPDATAALLFAGKLTFSPSPANTLTNANDKPLRLLPAMNYYLASTRSSLALKTVPVSSHFVVLMEEARRLLSGGPTASLANLVGLNSGRLDLGPLPEHLANATELGTGLVKLWSAVRMTNEKLTLPAHIFVSGFNEHNMALGLQLHYHGHWIYAGLSLIR